jgi:hypothetical protein
MAEHKINPEKVTKPIQLLAAWLVGLIAVNGSFLLAAHQISRPDWASALLVVCSALNVPVFIVALFLLQTKFRPQMQEDSYYSQYLEREKHYSQLIISKDDSAKMAEDEISETTDKIVKTLGEAGIGKEKPIQKILRQSQFDTLVSKLGGSRTLAELYKRPELWNELVKEYKDNEVFTADVNLLRTEGIVTMKGEDYRQVRLTRLGRQVAETAEKEEKLFSQIQKSHWDKWQNKTTRE